jgi:hypothetical protein
MIRRKGGSASFPAFFDKKKGVLSSLPTQATTAIRRHEARMRARGSPLYKVIRPWLASSLCAPPIGPEPVVNKRAALGWVIGNGRVSEPGVVWTLYAI